jgi:hypothetical protein
MSQARVPGRLLSLAETWGARNFGDRPAASKYPFLPVDRVNALRTLIVGEL